MPVHEFPILGIYGDPRQHPNYWGYDPMAFFAPHRGYAAGKEPGSQVSEFKEMVRALHEEGIEVILDLVFNHTAEGNERGPVFSFKGLDNHVYYMTDHGGRYYKNYTGCGNTVNCNHPTVKELIIDCLRHWVINYHVDGFRFDLAAVLRRHNTGAILFDLSLVDEIAADPYLASTKLIAEAWDAGGAFLVGNFGGKRWTEWNGHFRDDVRRFWRGDPGLLGALATRLGRLQRLVRTQRPLAVLQRQLRDLARWLHDERPRQLLLQTQRGQRGRQLRRGQQQLERQLRPRRSHAPRRSGRTPHSPDQEHAGHAAAQPRRAHAADGRRVPPHAARKQQRVLPGQ